MISKLRATGGAGFDLAQPSQDRIAGPQQEFGLYKPIDMSKIKTELFIPPMLEATKKNTTVKGQVYGLPHIWGTDGLVVNTKLAKMSDYPTCARRSTRARPACASSARRCSRSRSPTARIRSRCTTIPRRTRR
jgi:spermidine/putrescine transport system substrate-binding protein